MLFEDIYENYFKDVCRLCLSLTKNEENAEDLAQETFVKALSAIDTFDGSKDIRAWLFTIAKNTFFSECRKKKWIADGEVPEEMPSAEQDILEVISDKESAVLIHKYLHSMKEPYKEVFHLRVFGELDFEVIGNIFGKSASWARVTFYRAKNEIKNYMTEIGETYHES